jgi:hypothetical protein
MTLSRGLSGRTSRTARIARWTMPLWLYVSVTGVVVYLMLYRCNHGCAALTPVGSTAINPYILAGSTALVIARCSLLVYFYRRRLFILWWMGRGSCWRVDAAVRAPDRSAARRDGVRPRAVPRRARSLAFVVAADAYRQTPQLTRGYGLMLLPVAIYFVFLPVALGPAIVLRSATC